MIFLDIKSLLILKAFFILYKNIFVKFCFIQILLLILWSRNGKVFIINIKTMKTITESMTTPEFKKFVDFNELEVFTSSQVGQFAAQVAIDIKKSMNGELDTQSIEESKIELASMKPVNVVDNVGGSIVKSIFYVREKQVEETIEKSENGESHKIKFLDTELNRKLNRVGETLEKSMCDKTIKKSDELDYYVRLKKNGVSNPKEELKKSFNLDDEKADEIEKSFEDMLASKKEGKEDADKSEKKPEKKEGEEKEDDDDDSKKGEKKDVELNLENDGKEVEKSLDSMLEKINENFDKGLIDEFTYNSAGEQLATIFEKGLDKSRLTKKAITDKRGHRSSRWVRVNKEDGGVQSEPKSQKEEDEKKKQDEGDSGSELIKKPSSEEMKEFRATLKGRRDITPQNDKERVYEVYRSIENNNGSSSIHESSYKEHKDLYDKHFNVKFEGNTGGKRYELTEKTPEKSPEKKEPTSHFTLDKSDSIKVENSTLYRITASRDSLHAKKGEKGGYVEKPENLSGDAWISDNAKVYGDAQISGNAHISGDARISDNAKVLGDTEVYGKAQISGNAMIYGDAWVSGDAQISGNEKIFK